MSGKAVLVLVVGIIIIVGTVMFNIEAASTRIVRNFGDYYQRQTTQNIAQAGMNLALTSLSTDRSWRAGYNKLSTSEGTVSVSLSNQLLGGMNVVKLLSVGETDFGSSMRRKDTCVVYVRDEGYKPDAARALLTLNAIGAINGTITVDGRNFDLAGNLIPGTGVPGIWSTMGGFSVGGSAMVGGTAGGVDLAPAKVPLGGALALGQVYKNGFPLTPDLAMSGVTAGLGLPDGALKLIAQSGIDGSQYVTDPAYLKYPLTGVTYVEMPSNNPKNSWSSADIRGKGILVVHNTAQNAELKNTKGNFQGLIVADDMTNFHADFLGCIVVLKSVLSGNIMGNGNATMRYSDLAIKNATKTVTKAMPLDIVAWWE